MVIRENVELRDFSTLKTGGRARFFSEPRNLEEACEVFAKFHQANIPIRILGGGSNVLLPDEGFDGAILYTGRMRSIVRDAERLHVWAGASLPGLIHETVKAGYAGLQGLIGIPGTLGGAVRMNTGGKWGEIWDCIEWIELCDTMGKRRTLRRDQAQPQYRNGGIGRSLCLQAVLRLAKAEPKILRAQMHGYLQEKAQAQPLTQRSAGCIFKNPLGSSAGKLVDQAGCLGWREGDIAVSEKHGNFFVNHGKGSSAQVKNLIHKVRSTVRQKKQIELELEIDVW